METAKPTISPATVPAENAQPTGVNTLLAQLPHDLVAAAAAKSAPVDAVRAIADALQSEIDMRYKTVRRKVVRVLESHGVASAAELIAAAFDDAPNDDAGAPPPILALPSACPDPVNGVQLLDALRDEFRRYLSLPDHTAEAAALWVVHTFAHDLAEKSPILAVTSPTKRCGKTTMLTLLQYLCAKAVGLSSLTPAILYHLIDTEKPTLLIDEADTFLLDKIDLRGILNSGFSRGMDKVFRMVKGKPTRFSTWSPKAIACIGKLPDTLQDRSIEIRLQRKAVTEKVFRMRDTDQQMFAALAGKTLAWVDTNAASLRDAHPDIPDGLDDRAGDRWTPLLAIADVAGGHWGTTARAAAVALSGTGGEAPGDSQSELLLADLRDMFARAKVLQLTTNTILKRLIKLGDRPWSRFKGGRALTAFELGRLLAPFSVKSRMLRIGKRTARGYAAADLAPVFARYAARDETP